RDGERDRDPGEARVAGHREEMEDLAGGKGRGDRHDEDDPEPAKQQGDEERRHEDQGPGRALTEHPCLLCSSCRSCGQRPNRRVLLANSSSAASKASAPKSAQSTSVVYSSA